MSIHLDPNKKNIAVRLSGGPDSSIIYYAVCDFYKDKPGVSIYPYTMSTPLRPHSGRKAEKVVEVVTELTGVPPTKHYVVWNEKHNTGNSREVNSFEYTKGQDDLFDEIIKAHPIDIHYTGLSTNCPIDELEEAIHAYNLPDESYRTLRSRDDSRDVPTEEPLSEINGLVMCMPFARYDKRQVRKEFDRYGVVDTLFPHTWSCEHNSQLHLLDPVHCGKCYFCIERIYAFGKF